MGQAGEFKIKNARRKQWKEAVGNNALDAYSFGVIRAVVASFEILDSGGTPAEAEAAWKGLGLTGFMAGAAAKMIGFYHERGDEFRTYWNQQFGVSEAEAKGGTVNPAVVTMKDSGDSKSP